MHKNFNTTSYRHELRVRILETTIELFKKHGIKNVRMDDIASTLTISKRTLYEIYANKELLVFEGVKCDMEKRQAQIVEFAKVANNEMEIVGEALRLKLEDLSNINPAFFLDIQKYPDVVEYLAKHHQEQREFSMAFLKKGIEHGYFLPSFNYDFLTKVSQFTMMYVMEQRLYENYTMEEIFRNFVIVFLRGICTEKGIHLIDQYLNE